MIRSMTGYGTAECELEGGQVLRVEVKTVNHRHLNVHVRLPHGWDRLEARVGETVRALLSRGHVSLSVSHERTESEAAATARLDAGLAGQYVAALTEARDRLGLEGTLDVNTLARLPDVFRVDRAPIPEPDEDVLISCVTEALGAVILFRETEGRRLETDLRGCLQRIEGALATVEERAPERLVRERDRLREQIRQLSDAVDIDEDRLAREIAYLAERWDINEEVVRFHSHVALFTETLDGDGSDKVGKRLSFIVQEMNREANTIGSKANDAGIAAAAVGIKEELERLREQLENVE